ncbi:MAG: hypothetical protein PHD04_01500 [Candidatus Pacebacteria bacterium]|nr:hypothetical protein [Candidatus Paceibacterota bacterium]
MTLIVPAVLPSSQKDFEEKLTLFSSLPHISRVQIDIVDGKLAAPASFPYSAEATKGTPYPELIEMVRKGEMLPNLEHIAYEIDLMCFDALEVASAWLAIGASRLIFHTESSADMPHLLKRARREFGGLVTFGLALNIESSFALAGSCLSDVDYVQFMGIAKIGQQGQPFDERVLERIRTFHRMYPALPLQVDGGVSLENAKKLLALGVSTLVVGSAIVRSKHPAAEVKKFEMLRSPFGV